MILRKLRRANVEHTMYTSNIGTLKSPRGKQFSRGTKCPRKRNPVMPTLSTRKHMEFHTKPASNAVVRNNMGINLSHLIFNVVPLHIWHTSELKGGERDTHPPKEMVPPKPVMVPHTQPQGAHLQLTLLHCILTRGEKDIVEYNKKFNPFVAENSSQWFQE